MGKVDVGGGKPLAPSPKHSVAAPAPKHVYVSSFPKPSRGSVYQHAAPHRVVSHNAGYGPRPSGSGVHAAARAQPVKSLGHSAATARLASKLAQSGTAVASKTMAGGALSLRAAVLRGLLGKAGSPWGPPSAPLENWELHQPDAWWTHTRQGVYSTAGDVSAGVAGVARGGLGLPERPERPGYDIGPQGGLFMPGFPGYDHLPSQPPQGYSFHGVPAERIPIPKFNTNPRWRQGPRAGKPIPRQAQQRALGFTRNAHSPRPGLANPNSRGYGNTSA